MQNASSLSEPTDFNCLWATNQDEFVESYCKNFYWSKPDFLNHDQVQKILSSCKELDDQQKLVPAAIGKESRKQQNTEIRKDHIYWIDDFSNGSGQVIAQVFSGLQTLARSKLFLPARRFECHYAKFDEDAFYKRHSDRHQTHPSRLLTCIIYLSGLDARGGGELILYDEELRAVTIKPEPGRIVVFDSSIEHEVKLCRRERWSITGWIRSDLHPSLRFY